MKKIILYGDSIFNGFKADKKASPYNAFTSGVNTDVITKGVQKGVGEAAQVVNLSVNGTTVIDGLNNVKKVPADADIIVIEFGVNDSATWGISEKMYQSDLEKMVQALKPERCLIVGPSTPNPLNRKINIYFDANKLRTNNWAAEKIAAKYRIPFINWFKTIRNVTDPEDYYQIDGLHFTDKGYSLLIDSLLPAIKEKLQA